MPALVIQQIGRIRVIFCAACVLTGLFVTGCGSSEASSKISSTSLPDPTSAVLTPTSISTTDEAPTPLSTEELLTAKDQWGKFFKSLERCSAVDDTNCYQNAGTGSLNGSPIAATLYCDYKEYSAGQWACDWMIDFYKYSDARWLSSGSIQSQLYEMFDGALFAEMTGDTNSELYFSVMNVSFAEAEVLASKGFCAILFDKDFSQWQIDRQAGLDLTIGKWPGLKMNLGIPDFDNGRYQVYLLK